MKVTAVAVGGAFGAVLRYLISISLVADWLGKFPFHTFFINVSGSFLIGLLLVILTEKYAENEILRLALAVGFLGASTTFQLLNWNFTNLSANVFSLLHWRI